MHYLQTFGSFKSLLLSLATVHKAMVVHVQRTTVKNRIATHHCILVWWFMYKKYMINLKILPYKHFVMRKYSASCTDFPYQAGTINHSMKNEIAKITVAQYKASMVNHATKNETTKITVVSYQAGMVTHATMNKIVKITDTVFAWHLQWTPSTIQTKTN